MKKKLKTGSKKQRLVHLGTGNSIVNSTKRLDQLLFNYGVLVHHHFAHVIRGIQKEFFLIGLRRWLKNL